MAKEGMAEEMAYRLKPEGLKELWRQKNRKKSTVCRKKRPA